jgi:hypothetical protein
VWFAQRKSRAVFSVKSVLHLYKEIPKITETVERQWPVEHSQGNFVDYLLCDFTCVIITVILTVLELFLVTTSEYPINRLTNPNPV